jgi:TonB family protein
MMRGLFGHVCVVTLLLLASELAITQAQSPDNAGGAAPSASAAPAPGAASSGGAYRVGRGVTPPRAIYHPDPEYSEEARQDKFQGTCVLRLIVGREGTPRDIKVTQSLGHGLDEKAIEAVKRWTFEPGQKDGKPVATVINVQVSFRILDTRIAKLIQRADAGDAEAEFELGQAYLHGEEISPDEHLGQHYLLRAADQGLPKAQFVMGEYAASRGDRPEDYMIAYMWYALAEKNGYKQSKKNLKELAAKMSAENIAEAKTRAQSWPNLPGNNPRRSNPQ